MTEDNKPTSGGTHQDPEDHDVKDPKDGYVKFESHQKLLSEKKKLAEKYDATAKRLAELEAEKQDAETRKLEEQGEYQKISAQLKEENKALNDKLANIDKQRRDGAKIRALLTSINGEVEDKYWNHFDLDSVIIDPATNEIDEMSVTKEIERFRKEHAILIKTKDGPNLPADHPTGGGSNPISYEEWMKLPLKEMNARQNDVVD